MLWVLINYSQFTCAMSYEHLLWVSMGFNYSLSFSLMSLKSYVMGTGLIISFHLCYEPSNSYENLSILPFHMSWVILTVILTPTIKTYVVVTHQIYSLHLCYGPSKHMLWVLINNSQVCYGRVKHLFWGQCY